MLFIYGKLFGPTFIQYCHKKNLRVVSNARGDNETFVHNWNKTPETPKKEKGVSPIHHHCVSSRGLNPRNSSCIPTQPLDPITHSGLLSQRVLSTYIPLLEYPSWVSKYSSSEEQGYLFCLLCYFVFLVMQILSLFSFGIFLPSCALVFDQWKVKRSLHQLEAFTLAQETETPKKDYIFCWKLFCKSNVHFHWLSRLSSEVLKLTWSDTQRLKDWVLLSTYSKKRWTSPGNAGREENQVERQEYLYLCASQQLQWFWTPPPTWAHPQPLSCCRHTCAYPPNLLSSFSCLMHISFLARFCGLLQSLTGSTQMQARIQDFGQGDQQSFYPKGGPRLKFALNRGFSLKITWKLHDFKKILGATGAWPSGPSAWIRYWNGWKCCTHGILQIQSSSSPNSNFFSLQKCVAENCTINFEETSDLSEIEGNKRTTPLPLSHFRTLRGWAPQAKNREFPPVSAAKTKRQFALVSLTTGKISKDD